MPRRSPPRYVPTLTEVVREGTPTSVPPPELTEDQLVMRVMERVDAELERRLRETIAAAVIEHTRGLAPLLREEIESVVRETVSQAFADEVKPRQRQPR